MKGNYSEIHHSKASNLQHCSMAERLYRYDFIDLNNLITNTIIERYSVGTTLIKGFFTVM